MGDSDVRRHIDASLASGDWQRAAGQLRALWEIEGDPSQAAYIVSTFGRIREHLALAPHRLAILRSFTVEPIIPLLRAGAFAAGIDLAIHLGEFNAYTQELLDEGSALYRFNPDTILLAVQTRDLAPEQFAAQVGGWIRALRARTAANLVIHSLEQPSLSIYEGQFDENHTIHAVNQSPPPPPTLRSAWLRSGSGGSENTQQLTGRSISERHSNQRLQDPRIAERAGSRLRDCAEPRHVE